MSQVISTVLLVCSLIINFSAAVTVLVVWLGKIRSPMVTLKDRVTKLESEIDKIKMHQDNDNKRFIEQEKANKITQQSLLAIMNHLINNDDMDKLIASRDKLQNYLIEK